MYNFAYINFLTCLFLNLFLKTLLNLFLMETFLIKKFINLIYEIIY